MSACAECGSALATDQRYCLSCGARRGPRAPALERLLADLRPGGRASDTQLPAARWTRSALPGPRLATVLILAMLAFGTLTGVAASNPSGALRALRRGPLTLLVPAPAPAATTLAEVPPPVEATSTPEPVEAPAAAESAPAKSPEPSSSSSSGHKKSGGSSGGSTGAGGSHLPPVKHVFLIVLADQPYAQTFGPESPAPYLAHTLEHRGELLVRFYAVAHEELPNEVALISGLGPTPQTAADCPTFTDVVPGAANAKGQYTGQGCIYPTEAQTLGEQLAAKGLTWKVYAEGMAAACQHPEFGAADPTSQAPQGATFATFRDPFTYFDGVLHSSACAHDNVGLGGLAGDLRSAKRTPTLSYIVPGLCHDGRPTPCAPGAPAGLPAAETFLRRVVPEILASPAYRHGGLLAVTTDQAPATGVYGDSSSCCEQPRFPAPLGGVGSPGSATPGATATQPGATATQPGATTPTGTNTAATASATTTPTTTNPATTTPTMTTPTTTTPTATTPTASTPTTITPATNTPTTTTPAATAPGVTLPPSGGGQVGALLLSPYVKAGTYNQEPFNDFSLLHTLENLFGLAPLGYAASPHADAFEASVFSAYSG